MSDELWAGSCCEGMPIHITLGTLLGFVDEAWLADMVLGEYTLELTKWTDDRVSSTYLPRGEVAGLCKWLESYFVPYSEWHLSL